MGGDNKRKNDSNGPKGGKKAKTDIHKVGKYLPGGFPIDPKMKGVMVTCTRGREVQASREACDLLSEVMNAPIWPYSYQESHLQNEDH
jgi:tRNA acetyltransferase TAN1